jgi:anti-sigma factor RsiW
MVPGWIDGELDATESADFAAHLASCRDCADFAGEERAFAAGLRRKLRRPAMHPDERSQIMSDLRCLAETRRDRRRKAWGGAWAVAACLALLAGLAMERAGDWTRAYRTEHAEIAGVPGGLEIRSGSAPQVAAWLASAVGMPVHVPVMPGARLLGATTVELRGRRVGLAVYESGGRRLSLFLGNREPLFPTGNLAPDELFTRRGTPYSVVAWIHQGHYHVAVSDLPAERLQELARQCQKPAT